MIPHSRPEISNADIDAVVKALKGVRLAQGQEVAALEAELSAMFGGMEAVVVSSGTAALYLALAALEVGRGEKVVIPSYTCNSLFAAVSFTGGTAVCADTERGTINIGKSTTQAVMDESVKAVIVPHSCGYAADIPGISRLGRPVIEDCALAVGGRYPNGSLLGSKGDIAVLSFYATKLIQAGEGGACITANRNLAATIRKLRECDRRPTDARAFNFKMTDICAALAREKLKALPEMVKRRSAIADIYDKAFGAKSLRRKAAQGQAVCFRYIVETEGDVDAVIDAAKASGITCMRPIWRPLHASLGGACPNTDAVDRTLMSVPLYPALTDEEIRKICETLPGILSR